MKGLFHVLALSTILVGAVFSGVHSHKAEESSRDRLGNTDHRPGRRLEPTDNVIEAINQELLNDKNPRFVLTASLGDGVVDAAKHTGLKGPFARGLDSALFEVNVVLKNPSIDDSTSLSVDGGEGKPTNSTLQFLVADHQDDLSSSNFVLLVVDEEIGTIRGIVNKENRLYTWDQVVGEEAVVTEADVIPPDNWTCTVLHPTPIEDNFRRLQETREHSSQQEHNHDHSFIKDITSMLRIEKMNLQSRRHLYATDNFPNKYSYQVDLFIEVDTALVSFHDTDTVNMPNTG